MGEVEETPWMPTNFYPRPPRGGRPDNYASVPTLSQISIHALREEGDPPYLFFVLLIVHFYPRPPRGGRRPLNCRKMPLLRFLSTPSARRATFRPRQAGRYWMHFYPRPPRGGRHGFIAVCKLRFIFLSTPSARRATLAHAEDKANRMYFYPRPPRGGRQQKRRKHPRF